MDSRATTRTRLSVLPVLIAILLNLLLPISRAGTGLVSAADGIDDYSQCQIGNPNAGLDCESWINGILNATHNNYSEDEVVPQRLVIDFDDTDTHSVTLSYMTRKDSGTQNHAYDYLATWNHTYVNADRCQDLNPDALCVGGVPDIFPIPSDGASVSPGGPQPTSAHELPAANRQFVMYGGDITSTSAITHSTDPAEAGSDYGNITINFDVTDSNGRVMLLFGGHLAAGFGVRGWGAGLGAASISGGPYHIRVTGMDGASAGNRDNQIMSNAITPVPGLAISKSTSTPVISAGDTASYTITVTNSGQAAATGVMITDTLPGTMTWTDNSDSCTITGNALSCGPLSIPAASSFSVTVTGVTDATECPSISNHASYTSTNGGSGTTSATPTVITVNCPTITLQKTPDEDPQNPGANDVNVGAAAVFTITVSNSGPGTASGVSTFDDLPGTGWTVVGGDTTLTNCLVSDPATGPHADKGEILTCGPDTIAAAASKKVTVSRTTVVADCGELNNTASATSANDGSPSDSGNIDVKCPQIRIEKTPDENPNDTDANDVNLGDAATFTLTAFNDGSASATNVNVFDDLPGTGWSVVGADTTLTGCLVSDPATGPHADKGEILTCGPDTIAAGGSKKVTVTKTTAAADCGELNNTGAVTADNTAGDDDSGNIDVLCPQIRLEKEPDQGDAGSTVNTGGTAAFTITVHNDGSGEARDVNVFDDLPGTGWSVVGADTTLTGCLVSDPATGPHADKGEILTCGPDTIAAGGSKKVTVTNPISIGECADLPNAATATSSNADSSTDDGFIAVTCPDIDVTKTPDESVQTPGANDVNVGNAATFTITVSNSGDGAASGVDLFDDLPGTGWSVVGADTTLTGCLVSDPATGPHADKGEILTCGPDTIAAGGSKKVTVTKTTAFPGDCGTILNLATATASNADGASDNGEIDVLCPDLDIDKTTSTPTVNAGGSASYTITISNAGGATAATGVNLSDQLPAGIAWSDNTDLCSISAEQLLTCSDLEIAAGGSFSVTVTGITDSDDCPSILNRATFTSTNAGSGQTAPEGEGTQITVNCPDLAVEKAWVDANGIETTDPVDAGEFAYFAITVTNLGPGTATAVDVLDFAPEGTAWEVIDDGGFDCPEVIDDEGDTCTLASMAQGSATIVLRYLTLEADCGTLENNVEVSASNEPAAKVGPDNEAKATAVVECPGLNIVKLADADPIDAGDEASFHILIWNNGLGDALMTEFFDTLPTGVSWNFELLNPDDGEGIEADVCGSASGTVPGGEPVQTISCTFGTLEPSAMPTEPYGEDSPGKVIRVFGDTDRQDCGLLENEAWADASNHDRIFAEDTILVKCPTITLEKANDAVGSVLPGTTVEYTLTLTVDDGPAENVVVEDDMPEGLESPTDISDGGALVPGTRTIRWTLGTLNDDIYELTYNAVVADDVENGEELVNAAAATSTNSQCPDFETLGEECKDTSIVIPRVPTLVIDKVANAEVIVISGPNNALVATPSVVTWTLTYTLANGPVTDAVITDEVPVGFKFLDASEGGSEVDGVVTWTFETLEESGSVSFRTTVDPETISRVAPTVNVAVIDSDETEPDEGEDSVTVEVEPPVSGGNPTPQLPDTAAGFGLNGEPITVPVELMVAFFLGSLGALALANVRARSRRR